MLSVVAANCYHHVAYVPTSFFGILWAYYFSSLIWYPFYFSILSATFYVGALTRSLIPVTVSYPVDLLRMLLLARMSRVVLKDYESKSRSGVATHRLALGIYSLFSTTV